MTVCLECEDRTAEHADPRSPPLGAGNCLCRSCHVSALVEVFEEAIEEVRQTVDNLFELLP